MVAVLKLNIMNRLDIKSLFQNESLLEPVKIIPTGIKEIDNVIGGLYSYELITLLGDKTNCRDRIFLNILKNVCIDQKIPTAYFSTQNRVRYDIGLLLAGISDISMDEWYASYNLFENLSWAAKAFDVLSDSPIFYYNSRDIELDSLINEIRMLVLNHKVKVVFIDEYHSIEDRNEKEGIYPNAKHLKKLAIELEITIVVTSKRNYESEYYLPNLRDMTGFRGFGYLHEYSDTIIGICKPEDWQVYQDEYGMGLYSTILINVLKNQHGKLTHVKDYIYLLESRKNLFKYNELPIDIFSEK